MVTCYFYGEAASLEVDPLAKKQLVYFAFRFFDSFDPFGQNELQPCTHLACCAVFLVPQLMLAGWHGL